MADDTLQDAIETNAAGPKSASGDGQAINQHSLREQIEADRYLSAKRANKRGWPLKFFRFKLGR